MTEPLLEVDDIRTVFITDEGVVRAVDGVSFSMAPGERMGVVGESGSGKSVTARSIMGLVEPPGAVISGRVMFGGRDLLTAPEKELQRIRGNDIAMIFQDPMTALDPVFTIGDQMIETLVLHQDITKAEARELAAQALADVQIPNPAKRLKDHPHHFSGGMRQRVVIAMALMCHPSLLIADEPTTALDVTTQAQVLDLMLTLADDTGTAVMLITHDLGVVAGFCETVQVMYAGQIAERSPARDIYLDPRHPYTKGLLGSITRLDDDREGPLSSIAGSPPTLVDPPSGCRFWPRCPHAVAICTEVGPALEPISQGRTVACHLAADAALSKGAS